MGALRDINGVVFTVCNLAYLPKALVLAESLLKYGHRKLQIYLIDRKREIILPDSLAEFVWIEDVGVPDLYEQAFKYDITEFSTSVKPFITLKLLESFDKVIFLDPDICVYHSISSIFDQMDEHPIILTPHYTTPQKNDPAESDMGMMRFGSFNLGFFAVGKSEEGLGFLSWWNDRCINSCYFEPQFGLSTDQKWVSIAPCFFKKIYISFDMGLNVAFWNLHERWISRGINDDFVVNEVYPLIFFHFSSFDEQHPELLSKRSFPEKKSNRRDFLELCTEYKAALLRHKIQPDSAKYGFDYMSNGNYISPTLRRAYSSVVKELPAGHDPFDANSVVGRFAAKNNLIERLQAPYISDSYGEIKNHQAKFFVVNLLMRFVLRILGPNKFANFSRLLVYLSSYRGNRDLWKI